MLTRLLDTIVPLRCPGCGADGVVLCSPCLAALRPAGDRPPPGHLDALVGLLRYRGAAERVVARAKYRHDGRLLTRLGAALGPLLDHLLDEVVEQGSGTGVPVAVTWVPGTPRHRRARGGDPAATLARSAAATSAHRPGVSGLLRRLDDRPQAGRDRAGRSAGPRLAAVAPAPPLVVVVDDVCTTGASVAAAGRALRRAGASSVLGLVLAVRD